MVDAFVVTADEDKVFFGGEIADGGLLEHLALGSEENDLGGGGAQFFDGGEERFGLEEHALAAAAKILVGFAMLAGGPVAELVGVDGGDLIFAGAFDDALGKRSEGDLGKEGDDVDAHDRLK